MSTKYTFALKNVAKFTLTELFHQIIDIDMEIIIKFDEIHRGFGFHLVNDHISLFEYSMCLPMGPSTTLPGSLSIYWRGLTGLHMILRSAL